MLPEALWGLLVMGEPDPPPWWPSIPAPLGPGPHLRASCEPAQGRLAAGREDQQECTWGCLDATSLALLPLARTELSDHLDAMDSNLDNLQTMLTSHGFSVDTSTLLDVSPSPARPAPSPPGLQGSLTTPPSLQLFSPSVTVPDMSLPDLDSSLASVRRRGGWSGQGRGWGRGGAFTVLPLAALADPGAPLSPGASQTSGGREKQPRLR